MKNEWFSSICKRWLIYKCFFVIAVDMAMIKMNNIRIPRTDKIEWNDKSTKDVYNEWKYLLGRRHQQQKLGLRKYRIMRVFLKALIHASSSSPQAKTNEYKEMLQSTRLQ